jgi:effector-binding domain-containing protein
MKALKIIIYTLLGIAALIGGLGIFAKSNYHIERNIAIDAPKSMVYDQVLLFKNFHEWSPWSHLDPNIQLEYSATDGSVGSTYAWEGNNDVGKGKETITKISPERIDITLDFIKPFESTVPTSFVVVGDDQNTTVTWNFEFHIPFPYNVGAMFTDIDKAMGGDFERGLGYLKRRCEGMAHKKFNGYEVAEEEIPAAYYIGIRRTLPLEEIPAFYAESLPKIMATATTEKLTVAGPPCALYWTFDDVNNTTDMAVSIPMTEEKKLGKEYKLYQLGGNKALIINYMGDYGNIKEAHKAMGAYMSGNKLRTIPPIVESYITDPSVEPDTTKWRTKLIYFVESSPDSTSVDQ